eukprot:6202274-Pleurochrysis_carterae.AAC.2
MAENIPSNVLETAQMHLKPNAGQQLLVMEMRVALSAGVVQCSVMIHGRYTHSSRAKVAAFSDHSVVGMHCLLCSTRQNMKLRCTGVPIIRLWRVCSYDRIIEQQPSTKPYLWQRGLALFYADRFLEGAEQAGGLPH